jgi:hypothetical protein
MFSETRMLVASASRQNEDMEARMVPVAISNIRQQAPGPALWLQQPGDPRIALGLAVGHLMTKPAFARLRFGDWSRILIGQINRKHYRFVLDEKSRVVGFLG